MALILAPACVQEVELPEEPATTELAVDEARDVELRYLRLDVKDFPEKITIPELAKLPPSLLEETWLFDLDVHPLTVAALTRLAGTPSEEAYALPQPAQNLWRLLNMTPANAIVTGTRLEGLLALGEAVGISPARVLSDLTGLGENDPIIPIPIAAEAVVEDVISTHPNAQHRRGRVSVEHPDGLYPVTPGTIPLLLLDVATDLTDLAVRFGPAPLDPANPGGLVHPGFIRAASGLATTGEVTMTVKASLDALPFKGVDLEDGSVGNVNSLRYQARTAFDFSDPTWLTVDGLTPEVTIRNLTMAIVENPAFIAGGDSRDPLPRGNSPAWDLPPWELEHVLIHTAQLAASFIPPHCTSYAPQGSVIPPLNVVEVCIDATGWVEINLDPSVVLEGPAPAPAYFWDLLLEVAEARMHDGGLAEGEASPVLELHDLPVGLSAEELSARVQQSFEADPISLGRVAEALNDVAYGDPDLFYVAVGGRDVTDYLYFIAPADIRRGPDLEPVRPYAYAHPGFYADPELTQKVSSRQEVEGDVEHEKVCVAPGTVLYAEDEGGRLYAIHVGNKPSFHRISLDVTRIE